MLTLRWQLSRYNLVHAPRRSGSNNKKKWNHFHYHHIMKRKGVLKDLNSEKI